MHHIYIHIPFCLKKCRYCAFYSVAEKEFTEPFMKALLSEIEHYGNIYVGTEIETIFFGGGTPSILIPNDIEKILNGIRRHWSIANDAEVSFEINPETVDEEKLVDLKDAGINRASIGIQSFDDNELKYLGRVHDSRKAKETLISAIELFENVSVDLMFGLPGQSFDSISKNIHTAVKLGPKHISCYELTFEEETDIFCDKDLTDTDDPSLYLHTKELLEKSGYKQYEISNYSRPDFECLHNMAYWSDKSYLGFGPSAHSYDREKKIRWANRSDVKSYASGGRLEFTEPSQEIDIIISGLRKTNGIGRDLIPEQYRDTVSRLINKGLLEEKNSKVAYTANGQVLSNRILLELFSTE